MLELFKTLEILDSILSAENPVQKARKHRKAILAEIENLERRMFEDMYMVETFNKEKVL